MSGGAHGVALALALIVTAGCSPDEERADPTPSPSVSTTQEATSTGSLPNPGSVEPGSYALAALESSPVVQLGDGWWAGWDYGDGIPMPDGVVALEHRLSRGFVRLAFWDTGDLEIGGSVRPDVRAFVRELPTVTDLAEQTVVIGGVDATRFDFGWTGGFERAITIPGTAFEFSDDEPQHWIVLDTADGPLLVNWTVEDAGGERLEAEAEELVGGVLSSFRR